MNSSLSNIIDTNNFCKLYKRICCICKKTLLIKFKKKKNIICCDDNCLKEFKNNYSSNRFCKIYLIVCKVCTKEKLVKYKSKHNKTCGNKDCIIQLGVGVRDYPNGNKKLTWFYNKFEDKNVLLESSWEVRIANFLTDKNIKWIRPKFIKWQDSIGKTRRYFPDFYLVDYDIYLDPKNPYCLKRDEEKLNEVQKKIKLIFGNPDMIEEWLKNNCKK